MFRICLILLCSVLGPVSSELELNADIKDILNIWTRTIFECKGYLHSYGRYLTHKEPLTALKVSLKNVGENFKSTENAKRIQKMIDYMPHSFLNSMSTTTTHYVSTDSLRWIDIFNSAKYELYKLNVNNSPLTAKDFHLTLLEEFVREYHLYKYKLLELEIQELSTLTDDYQTTIDIVEYNRKIIHEHHQDEAIIQPFKDLLIHLQYSLLETQKLIDRYSEDEALLQRYAQPENCDDTIRAAKKFGFSKYIGASYNKCNENSLKLADIQEIFSILQSFITKILSYIPKDIEKKGSEKSVIELFDDVIDLVAIMIEDSIEHLETLKQKTQKTFSGVVTVDLLESDKALEIYLKSEAKKIHFLCFTKTTLGKIIGHDVFKSLHVFRELFQVKFNHQPTKHVGDLLIKLFNDVLYVTHEVLNNCEFYEQNLPINSYKEDVNVGLLVDI
ncbi:MAG: hypothetical protein MHMPM18_003609 [Marteilia pararefringens]